MPNLTSRYLTIGAAVLVSLFALLPRQVIERVNRDGQFVYDTVQRVPLKRGLDLQGGMHLALEIDESKGVIADKAEALDRAVKVVRTRIDEFGVSEPIVQKLGEDRIIVELPGIDDPQRAQGVVQKNAFLQFQITDKTQSLERVAGRLDAVVKARGLAAAGPTTDSAAATKSLFAQADTAAAADDSAATAQGIFSTRVQAGQIPGQYVIDVKDYPLFDRALNDSAVQAALPPGKVVRWGMDSVGVGFRTLYVLDARDILTGESLTDARPVQDAMEGTVVSFELNAEGGRRFRTETGKHIGDYMAIVLDERVMTAPVIQGAIGTRGQITLGRPRHRRGAGSGAGAARRCAARAAQGRRSPQIGPSLGEDSIDAGSVRCWWPCGSWSSSWWSTIASPVCSRRRPDAVRAVHAGHPRRLRRHAHAARLAGFVLSVGIAVDANILIFERIREELDAGKTHRLADRGGLPARHERHRRLQRDHRADGCRALPVRHRPGARLRRHAARGYRRLAVLRHLRRQDLLPVWLARQGAGPDPEHLMLRILHEHLVRFHQVVEARRGLTTAFVGRRAHRSLVTGHALRHRVHRWHRWCRCEFTRRRT
jgi:preprotein translocase subunit SecD